MKRYIYFFILIFCFFHFSLADTRHVPQQYTTIQQAIDSCNSGDTILVAPGEYRESLLLRGKNLVFASHYILQGDTSKTDSTILSSSDGSIFEITSEIDSLSVIGFKIEGSDGDRGGAIYAYDTKVTIKNNHFYFSSAGGWRSGFGGAVYAIQSDMIINNNLFDYCESDYGGAIYASSAQLEIKNNIFKSNRALIYGGAMALGSCIVDIKDNLFIHNWGFSSGGAVSCSNSEGDIHSNIFKANVNVDLDSTGSEYAGGLSCSGKLSGSAWLKVKNNIFEKNRASNGGAVLCGPNVLLQNNLIINNREGLGSAIYITDYCRVVNNTIYGNNGYSTIYIQSGGPEITNNIIWGNKLLNEWKTIYKEPSPGIPAVTYNDIQDGYEGTGNFSDDPLFRNLAAADFHLKSTSCADAADSPCIDNGSPVYTDALLDCQAGLGSALSDVGAYGGGIGQPTSIEDDENIIPDAYSLFRVFPNPFNARVTIIIDVKQLQNLSLNIYNISGEKVYTLYQGLASIGQNSFTWDGRNDQNNYVSSNIYFVHLVLGKKSYFKKIILIK